MKDVDKSLENNMRNIEDAKKFSMELKASALQQLILQRFQALTNISSIGFGVSGIVISVGNSLIQNQLLAVASATLFIFIALISLGRYLYLIRSDIEAISKRIKDLPDEDWGKPFKKKDFKADWWPETLYILLVIGILLFGLSFLL